MDLRPLSIGVIRDAARFRANAKSEIADREYRAKRPAAMERGKYRCAFCGWRSIKNNECHHVSGDHSDNSEENLVIADSLCHGYHHLGQRASQERFAPDNLGDKTVLASIPEVSASDLNLLLRAIGVALGSEDEAPIAEGILRILADRARPVQKAFGTFYPGDFAAAMTNEQMTEQQYRIAMEQLLPSFRLIFHKTVLEAEAKKFKVDYPALPFSSWSAAVQKPN